MAGKRNTSDAIPVSLTESQAAVEQPTEGGSYTRCQDTGELTLVARTSHETTATANEETTSFESQESQA